ncbi:hypothetical protein SAMN02745116_02241 [Pilibacter termitis]|uniref:DUF3221 domain-containing protein n=1 Tax=Pilibacter termitis TaxID=263852 RepID=A0A1T4QNM6_9ENTE|nr:hypothetical protein [Pilibacter termitis]SKA04848.1 hypothetical protein SAMN02745116_02241 [Pilibacter termitis]
MKRKINYLIIVLFCLLTVGCLMFFLNKKRDINATKKIETDTIADWRPFSGVATVKEITSSFILIQADEDFWDEKVKQGDTISLDLGPETDTSKRSMVKEQNIKVGDTVKIIYTTSFEQSEENHYILKQWQVSLLEKELQE